MPRSSRSTPTAATPPSLVIHGHFYQPPRENPYLDEVETEQSAAPFHNWNQRIERECYRAVVAARVQGADGRITHLVNTLEWISFNYGSTLLEWLERNAVDTYRAILLADRVSAQRLGGHGNAIAQPYHHVILPLATRRDKVTEVRWGITDFKRRFGREPEGMWLPETAVDEETLDVLATEGIRFTILAPHQVENAPPSGAPGRYVTTSGREIALCVYNGDLAHGVAFGGLLHDARHWINAIEKAGTRHAGRGTREDRETERSPLTPRHVHLVSIATDGETYGHHHRFGEMALARTLEGLQERGWRMENYASFLSRHPAARDVTLVEPTAWSCAHGVERWRSDCGCRVDGTRNPSQAWRAPLRHAMEELAEGLHAVFEREGKALFTDPWMARDAYGAIVGDAERDMRATFLRAYGTAALAGSSASGAASSSAGLSASLPGSSLAPHPSPQECRALELLEMERDALRMFTSCAWFFDDIGGIEPRQVLGYAARAMSLAGEARTGLESALLATLATASSNDATVGTGREVYLSSVRTQWPASLRIAAAELAARHVGVHHGLQFAAAEVEVKGSSVFVRDRRTWRASRYHVEGVASVPGDISVQIRWEGGHHGQALHLAALPERARMEVRSVLRRRLLPVYLSPVELDHLAAGDVQLRGVVAVALTRAVERLAEDSSELALANANGLLDLFEQIEAKVPFDTQTAFWQVWQATDGARQEQLAELKVRLGFAKE